MRPDDSARKAGLLEFIGGIFLALLIWAPSLLIVAALLLIIPPVVLADRLDLPLYWGFIIMAVLTLPALAWWLRRRRGGVEENDARRQRRLRHRPGHTREDPPSGADPADT